MDSRVTDLPSEGTSATGQLTKTTWSPATLKCLTNISATVLLSAPGTMSNFQRRRLASGIWSAFDRMAFCLMSEETEYLFPRSKALRSGQTGLRHSQLFTPTTG